MDTLRVDILNPKAKKLLQTLADINLISIQEESNIKFKNLLERLRSKNSDLTLDEITEEVELVRAARYAEKKPENNS